MRIIQFIDSEGTRRVAIVRDADTVTALAGAWTTYGLVQKALAAHRSLDAVLAELTPQEDLSYGALIAARCLLPPIDHPDPAHTLVTGTGLTHLGSAQSRNRMHQDAATVITDSMRMFQWGLEGGKPAPGQVGVQPEWFYKGDGSTVIAPYHPLPSPPFALDAGEEPEIAGLYVIGPEGAPYRVGFALGNEFSDHVMEKQNYLYLAHSKLRPCAIGPELRLGALPSDVRGWVRILREGATLWEKPFLSGEDHMSHTIANLEYHHFKYRQFRRPGDVHVHFFGTATLSFADGIRLQAGDEIEIAAEEFGRPLRNTLTEEPDEPAWPRPL